jgi:hypothetical protein
MSKYSYVVTETHVATDGRHSTTIFCTYTSWERAMTSLHKLDDAMSTEHYRCEFEQLSDWVTQLSCIDIDGGRILFCLSRIANNYDLI